MENQRIIHQHKQFFSFKSWTMDVVITVGKVRAPKAGRRSGAPNMYVHISLIFGGYFKLCKEALIVMSVDYKLRWLSIAFIVALQNQIYENGADKRILQNITTVQT
jgi:hypothetical protein